MMVVLIILVVAGIGVSATSPKEQKERPPIVPIECGPNSHFERCSKICPPQDCSALIDPCWSCENPGCKPQCRCDDGFYRQNGTCISRNECLAQCGPLERYVADTTKCERTCANYKVTAPRSLCKPFSGCFCEEGRVRLNENATGPCVLPKDCPHRPCPLHEHWQDCPSVCANETCISKSPSYKCLLPAVPLPCKGRCMCDKGYLRNHVGDCVPENHCPIKECPINEVWRCASMCPRDSCKRLEPGFQCPSDIISVCIPACVCKDGYMRNDEGICIPRELCPASLRCGINEVAVECQAYPPQTCESVYTVYEWIEDPPCTPGCDCRPGYLRNKHNICVPSEFCPTVPPNKCGPNQEYKECGTRYEPSCSNLDDPPTVCSDVCVEGCFCKEGFLKDEHGNCVYPSECPLPICNKPNEVAKDCGSYCEMRTCEDYNRTDIVCAAVCVRGCFCSEGYVRNPYGVCIHPKKCPSKPVCLQEHEEYQSCGSSCPDNCDNYMDPDHICTMQCVAGCNCKKGYVRNLKDGTCINPEQCPIKECTGENEDLNYCASYCPVTCANRYTQGDWACITLCREACDCIPGTLRNDTGSCVPVQQCTPPICRDNEKYMKCGTACPKTCDNYKNPPEVCTQQCIEDCFCKDGYVRNRFGRCVKPEDCEPTCPTGEKWSECSAHCQDTCENYNSSSRICTLQCQSGCVCETGTVRRNDGKCVRPTECTENITCPIDEMYDPCSAHCETTCENHGPDRACTDICKPGCRCGEGLVRRKDGKCVKLEDCHPKCPVNKRWVDCVMALCIPLACDQLGFPIACPGIIGPCDGGCVCAENYVRDNNNVCIPKRDCPSCNNDFNATSGCGIHCGKQCTDYKNPPKCNLPMPCQYNGCDCKKGFVWDIVTDRCLDPVDCPVPCKGDLYAEKVKCPIPCPATCARPTTAICPKACLKVGCQCRSGLVLNPDGKCVWPENCPDNLGCNGDPNAQISSCVSLCEPTCGENPVFCPAVCRLGCKCKSGFILSKAGGICIKSEKCVNATTTTEAPCKTSGTGPRRDENATTSDMHATGSTGGQQNTSSHALILCRNDEIWVNCKPGYCKPQYCRDIGRVMTCPQVADTCPGGCICREGLLRNKDGVCIPENECPINKPCSDPNEIRKKCASHEPCRATCLVPNPKICPRICIINGCECKKGYVLSGPRGKCTKIEDCPKGNVSCNGDQNAEIIAFPLPCPSTCKMPNGSPVCLTIGQDVGCVCKPGYIKDDNDKCIRPDNCKDGNPCGANATFAWCKVNCPDQYCPVDDRRGIIACDPPYPCPSGCVCKLNHKRKSQKDDRCILSSDCPPVKCTRPNEIWSPCPSACLSENCEDVSNQPTTCNTLVLNCEPRCICKKGHFRNASDICVPAKECPNNQPQPCDDLNAERSECAPAPSCRSTCERPNPGPCVLSCAVNECVCKKGFVLSKKGGKCIPVDQCPKDVPCNGDSNAVIIVNPPPCPSTCDSPNASHLCRRAVPPVACQCKDGFIKSTYDGKCIKPEECPGGNPCGANSTFVSCNVRCPNGYCPVNDKPVNTPCELPYPCPSGCACKINYKRKSVNDERCILSSTCPPVKCTRPNERWDPCPSACLAESCADVDNQPTTCNTLILNCQPQSVCKKGYFRNSTISNGFTKDTCIPAKDCPQNKPCEDPYAERMECAPHPSCRSTCATPSPSPCIEICAIKQCVCKKGYVLSTEGGKCIPVDQCPKGVPCNGDRNAIIKANPIPCPSTCSSPNADPRCKRYAPPVGCECKPGYLLSDEDICIEPDQCPAPPIKCKENEVYDPCPPVCPPQTCESIFTSYNCQEAQKCEPGCKCISEYMRNGTANDPCIPSELCPTSPPVCGINEHYGRNSNKCELTCKNYHLEPVMGPCQATSACFCDDGYVKNSNGLCVPKKQCPQNVVCPPNEVASECYNSCLMTCKTRLRSDGRMCHLACIETGCVCKEDYLRHDNGTCVPISQCSPPRCDENETYSKCGTACPPTCQNRGDNCTVCTKQCVEDCFCNKGLVRSDDGSCIKPKECLPRVCGPNETFHLCPPTCPPTDGCSNMWSKFNCTNAIKCCKPQCRCNPGYLRKDKVCVPTEKCLERAN